MAGAGPRRPPQRPGSDLHASKGHPLVLSRQHVQEWSGGIHSSPCHLLIPSIWIHGQETAGTQLHFRIATMFLEITLWFAVFSQSVAC